MVRHLTAVQLPTLVLIMALRLLTLVQLTAVLLTATLPTAVQLIAAQLTANQPIAAQLIVVRPTANHLIAVLATVVQPHTAVLPTVVQRHTVAKLLTVVHLTVAAPRTVVQALIPVSLLTEAQLCHTLLPCLTVAPAHIADLRWIPARLYRTLGLLRELVTGLRQQNMQQQLNIAPDLLQDMVTKKLREQVARRLRKARTPLLAVLTQFRRGALRPLHVVISTLPVLLQ